MKSNILIFTVVVFGFVVHASEVDVRLEKHGEVIMKSESSELPERVLLNLQNETNRRPFKVFSNQVQKITKKTRTANSNS